MVELLSGVWFVVGIGYLLTFVGGRRYQPDAVAASAVAVENAPCPVMIVR